VVIELCDRNTGSGAWLPSPWVRKLYNKNITTLLIWENISTRHVQILIYLLFAWFIDLNVLIQTRHQGLNYNIVGPVEVIRNSHHLPICTEHSLWKQDITVAQSWWYVCKQHISEICKLVSMYYYVNDKLPTLYVRRTVNKEEWNYSSKIRMKYCRAKKIFE